MDPYLEQPVFWPPFHNKFANKIQEALNITLPEPYVAMVEFSVEIGFWDTGETCHVRPDVLVHRRPAPAPIPPSSAAIVALLEIDTLLAEEIRVFSVYIRDLRSSQLVTMIEMLSPVNKQPGNRAYEEYLRKRSDLLRTATHLLEIDLLRRGRRVPMLEPLPDAPYFIILGRSTRRPRCEIWPVQLADPLPVIPVPLQADDSDVRLDLAAVFAEAYNTGNFGRLIDYDVDPPGPLTPQEHDWLEKRLIERGFRA